MEKNNPLFLIKNIFSLKHSLDTHGRHSVFEFCFQVQEGQGTIADIQEKFHQEETFPANSMGKFDINFIIPQIYSKFN